MSEELEWELIDIFESGLFVFPIYNHQSARRIIRYLLHRGVLAEEIADAIEDNTFDLYIWLNRGGKNMVGEWVIAWINDARDEYYAEKAREEDHLQLINVINPGYLDTTTDTGGSQTELKTIVTPTNSESNLTLTKADLKKQEIAKDERSEDGMSGDDELGEASSGEEEEAGGGTTTDGTADTPDSGRTSPPPLPPPRTTTLSIEQIQQQSSFQSQRMLHNSLNNEAQISEQNFNNESDNSISQTSGAITRIDQTTSTTSKVHPEGTYSSIPVLDGTYSTIPVQEEETKMEDTESEHDNLDYKSTEDTESDDDKLDEKSKEDEDGPPPVYSTIPLRRVSDEDSEDDKLEEKSVDASESFSQYSEIPTDKMDDAESVDKMDDAESVDKMDDAESVDKMDDAESVDKMDDAESVDKMDDAESQEDAKSRDDDIEKYQSEVSEEVLGEKYRGTLSRKRMLSYEEALDNDLESLEGLDDSDYDNGNNFDNDKDLDNEKSKCTVPRVPLGIGDFPTSLHLKKTGLPICPNCTCKLKLYSCSPLVRRRGTTNASSVADDHAMVTVSNSNDIQSITTEASSGYLTNANAQRSHNDSLNSLDTFVTNESGSVDNDTCSDHYCELFLSESALKAMEVNFETLDKDGPGFIFIMTDCLTQCLPWSGDCRYKIASSRQPDRCVGEFQALNIQVEMIWRVMVEHHTTAVKEVHSNLDRYKIHSNWFKCPLSTIVETVSKVARKYRLTPES